VTTHVIEHYHEPASVGPELRLRQLPSPLSGNSISGVQTHTSTAGLFGPLWVTVGPGRYTGTGVDAGGQPFTVYRLDENGG
jgi:hypothetical protein